MRAFEIALINIDGRFVRTVIAETSIAATRIGLSMLPVADAPMAIICKPMPTLLTRSQPCTA